MSTYINQTLVVKKILNCPFITFGIISNILGLWKYKFNKEEISLKMIEVIKHFF